MAAMSKLGASKNNDRFFTLALVLLLAYAAVRFITKAAIRPFWSDEICTWVVARQPSLPLIWQSLARGADGQPPFYYVIERISDKLVAYDHVSFRIPSILAFCFLEWCLFAWLRKRYDGAVAFVAALIPFLMIIFETYSVEARPYCLLTASLGLALVAYQRIPSLFWTVVLGLSLLFAQAIHYYAIFMATPFLTAEAFYSLRTKSLRWPVWAAFSATLVPLALFWPILSRFRTYYSGHYWSQPRFIPALRIYGILLGLSQEQAPIVSWPLLAGYFVAAMILIASAFLIWRAFRMNPDSSPFFHEPILIASFLLLPPVLFFATRISHAGFVPRHLVPVTIGYVMLAAHVLSRLNRSSVLIVGGALCLCFVFQEANFWLSFRTDSQLHFLRPRPAESLVAKSRSPLPVVISDGSDFFEMQHYATPDWKQRFNYIADPDGAVAYGRSDTSEKELLVLRDFTPMRVFSTREFSSATSRFLLFSNPKPENTPDWRISRLASVGYSLQSLATDGHDTVYLVESGRHD